MSNLPPPASWYATGFDDSGWAPGIVIYPDIGTGGAIWPELAPPAADEQALGRRHFFLPPRAVSSATLTVAVNDQFLAAYLNGTLVHGAGPTGVATVTIPIDITLLVVGGQNVLAFWLTNQVGTGPGDAFLVWSLTIN